MYNLLAASTAAKTNQLASAGWMTDEAGKFDDSANAGFKARKLWTQTVTNSTPKVCYLAGPLSLDVALQKQYLTDRMKMSFKFTRNSHAFALQSFESDALNETYKIRFLTMALWLRRVRVSPSVMVGHMKGLGSQNALWKYPGVKVFTTFHSKGVTTISIPNQPRASTPSVCILLWECWRMQLILDI